MDSFRPDVLHVHDLTIARAAFRAIAHSELPVVLDLHENRPVIMKEYVHLKKWPGKWIISPSTWEKYQKKYCEKADRVVVVTDEAAQDLSGQYAIDPALISVVPNTVDTSIYMKYRVDAEVAQKWKDGFNILYMGDTGLRRGTDTAIRALSLLINEIPHVRLILVGSNTEDVRLRDLAAELGVSDQVFFEGWQDVALFPSYVSAADVCLSPLKRNRHHDTTFANKIFQYMAGGKPLVVSNCPPQQRVVENENCGLVHNAGDAEDLASCILEIYQNAELAGQMGKNALNAVTERWNWQKTAGPLLALYRGLSA
jgi:glycosyltransferase involved in cell wall biosynthesis